MTGEPWPGPRPFLPNEWRQFAGRDRDLADILEWIDNGSLVIELTGESGIGKTSFLRAGLVPTLTGESRGRQGDYNVLLCREWPQRAQSGEELYCRALSLAEIPAGGVPLPEVSGPEEFDTALVRSMVASAGPANRVVIVFDQVEELFRRNRVLAERFLKTVGHVATTMHVAHILSLRDEYKHELRSIERLLDPSNQEWLKLAPVVDVEEVIRQPAESVGFPIEPEAVTELAHWWKAAQSKQQAGSQTAGSEEEAAVQALGATLVGLLHLQALLWSVYEYWKHEGSPADGVTPELIDRFRSWAADRSTAWSGDDDAPAQQDESALVADAVLRWIQERVAAKAAEGGHRASRSEALFAAARAAPHLSSRGYKLARPAAELTWLALRQEFNTLQASRRSVSRAILRLNDDDDAASSSSAADFPELEEAPQDRIAGRIVSSDDPTPRHAALALCAAIVDGIKLLVAADIVRQPSVVGGDRFYELVHDGYGPPLAYWAELELRKPIYDTQPLVVIRGLDLVHDFLTPKRSSLGCRELHNIGWWSCLLRPRSRKNSLVQEMDFQGCDLRGTLFYKCSLSKVTFHGTNLLGVVFDDCDFDDVVIDGGLVSGLVVKNSRLRGSGLTLRHITGSSDVSFIKVRGSRIALDRCDLPHITFVPEGLEHLAVERSVLSRSLLMLATVSRVTLTESTLRFVEIDGSADTAVTADPAQFVNCQCNVPVHGTVVDDGLLNGVASPKYGPAGS